MVDANVLLEDELLAARASLAQVEAQRDFLLERLVDLEGDVWEVHSDGEERPPALVSAKRKATLIKNEFKVGNKRCAFHSHVMFRLAPAAERHCHHHRSRSHGAQTT
jgi:hypothetical protein